MPAYGRVVREVNRVDDNHVEYRVDVNPGATEFAGSSEFHYLNRLDGNWSHKWNDVFELRAHPDRMTDEAETVLRGLDLL